MEFRGINCLNDRECWNRGIELKFDLLQQQRVINYALGVRNFKKPISQDELESLCFALKPTPKFEEFSENLHRLANRSLRLDPVLTFVAPSLHRSFTPRISIKSLFDRIPTNIEIARADCIYLSIDVLPSRGYPVSQDIRRRGAGRFLRPPYLQNESRNCSRTNVRRRGCSRNELADFNGRILRQIIQEQVPVVFRELPDWRCPNLLKCGKEAENLTDLRSGILDRWHAMLCLKTTCPQHRLTFRLRCSGARG